MLTRCMPLPGAGLNLMNLREILEKCRQECDPDLDLCKNLYYIVTNGNHFYEQALVLSKTSLIDIVGMKTSTLVSNIHRRIQLVTK